MRNSERRFCEAGIKTESFTARLLRLKQNKKELPHGDDELFIKIISEFGRKVSFAVWWIILQQCLLDRKPRWEAEGSHSPDGVYPAGAAAAPGGAADPLMPTRVPWCCFHLEEAG